MTVDARLKMCLVFGMKKTLGGEPVFRFKRGLLASFVVLAPEDLAAPEETEFVSLNSFGNEPKRITHDVLPSSH